MDRELVDYTERTVRGKKHYRATKIELSPDGQGARSSSKRPLDSSPERPPSAIKAPRPSSPMLLSDFPDFMDTDPDPPPSPGHGKRTQGKVTFVP